MRSSQDHAREDAFAMTQPAEGRRSVLQTTDSSTMIGFFKRVVHGSMLAGLAAAASLTAFTPAALAQSADGGVADGGAPPSADDEKMLKEIEAAAAAHKGTPAPPEASAPAAPEKGKTSSFFSNVFNPAMSVNGLFLGSLSSQDHPPAGD